MAADSKDPSSPIQEHYINQMAELQRVVLETQQALQQLRQDARTDGVSVDALNLLIQVRGRNLPDGGTRILNELVSYAHQVGIEFDQIAPRNVQYDGTERNASSDLPEVLGSGSQDMQLLNRISPFVQLAVGALISAAMLWYLQ